MNSSSDQQLLRDYTGRRSEAAFAEVVRRHVDFVYSVARRMVHDAHLAEDVTQRVFLALAQDARRLANHPVLSGWLHRTTLNIAAETVRSNVRRYAREQEAAAMNESHANDPDALWERIEPQLDDALNELSTSDREALLLRYFERQSARAMAQTLGTSEDAAQKRVNRAVERLREYFAQQGVTVGASGLVVAISTHAVQAAPVGIAVTISTVVSLAGPTFAAATASTTTAIVMTTLQKSLVTVSLAVAVGAGIYQTRQAAALRTELQTLRQQQSPLADQLTQLKIRDEQLSHQVAQDQRSASVRTEYLRELLKLRGEVGVLRRQKRELELAAAQAKAGGANGQTSAGATASSNRPSPFQVQLVVDEPGENTQPLVNTNGAGGPEILHAAKTPLLDYTAVSSAAVSKNQFSGAPQIDIEFSEVGKELFAAVTRENIDKRLAIVLDGQLFSAPIIKGEITGGKAQITGSFTEAEAAALAAKINAAIGGQ